MIIYPESFLKKPPEPGKIFFQVVFPRLIINPYLYFTPRRRENQAAQKLEKLYNRVWTEWGQRRRVSCSNFRGGSSAIFHRIGVEKGVERTPTGADERRRCEWSATVPGGYQIHPPHFPPGKWRKNPRGRLILKEKPRFSTNSSPLLLLLFLSTYFIYIYIQDREDRRRSRQSPVARPATAKRKAVRLNKKRSAKPSPWGEGGARERVG